ncbi:hypothetical protein CCMA1212_000717, partial [Trichoderma ghanense]
PPSTTNQQFQQSSPSFATFPLKRYNLGIITSPFRRSISQLLSPVITHRKLKLRSPQHDIITLVRISKVISVCVSVPFSRERCASSALVYVMCQKVKENASLKSGGQLPAVYVLFRFQPIFYADQK